MAQFRYRAINQRGRWIRGTMAAINEIDLNQQLQNAGMTLVDAASVTARKQYFTNFSRPTTRELIQLCVHLEQLSRAGIGILEGLADVRDSTENPALADAINSVLRDISEGSAVSDAFAKHPRIFPPLFRSVLSAGEETGKLTEAFTQLVRHLKWSDAINSRIKRAVRYPAFLGIVVVLVVIFMMGFVVPGVVEFLKSAGVVLPFLTVALIATSNVVAQWWPLALLLLLGTYIGLRTLMYVSEGFRFSVHSFVLRMPIIGMTIRQLSMARFTHTFSVMLASGLEIAQSLDAAARTISNMALMEALRSLKDNVMAGNSLSSAVRTTGEFPSLVIRMIKIGEDSGRLPEILEQVGEFYDREVDEKINSLIGMLEPVLTIVLGGIMAWIAIGVFGPVYSSLSVLSGQ